MGILFSGLTLALLLALAKRQHQTANLFLGSALAAITLKAGGLTPVFLPAIGPLLYFYVRQRTCPDRRFSGKDILHFCPLLAGYWMPVWLISGFIIVYLYLSHRLIQHFYNNLRPVLMDRRQVAFRQLNRWLFVLGTFFLLWLFNDIFFFAIAFTVIGMAVNILLRPDNDVEPDIPITDRFDAREKGRRLKEMIVTNRLYEDAELTLATLAAKLNIHPHDLSRIINVGLEKNFSDFINEFRVREVVRKMQDPAYERLTLLGIAYESGFNSQRTFNRVFKELTGKTPLEYKNTLRKELPIDKLAAFSRVRPLILRPESLPKWASEKSKRNIMIPNFFKVAFRTLWRSKSFSAINIAGLAIGMASAILILLWVQNELSYDRFYTHTDRIAQLYSRDIDNGQLTVWGSTTGLMAQELKSYPEVENAARFRTVYFLTSVGDRHFNTEGAFADSTFLPILDFPLAEGNAKSALSDNHNIVITQSMAARLFGKEDAMGKTVLIDSTENFKVTGVLKDLPGNTQFTYQYLLPWSYITKLGWDQNQSWATTNGVTTYVLLKQGAPMTAFDQKIKNIVKRHVNRGEGSTRETFVQPINRLHLYSRQENGRLVDGRIEMVRMFITIAVFILLIACINFMNLSTAKSEKRAKEAGIRKVIGARRDSLIFQFIGESTIIAIIAFGIALLLVQLS
ncbi:MAG: ABC transporter permease, partial [Bacteroidetes bacterium]|nr:ABC transporter permease [Bacteroidota bacterium]